jgi:hypothetical protein
MNKTDEHLSGEELEALAAGQPSGSPNAAGHLAACTRCHDALSAVRAENRLFAAELSQENSAMELALDRPARATHALKPFVMYLIAASIMLACALALIWSGRRKDDSQEVAHQKPELKTPVKPTDTVAKKTDERAENIKEDAAPKPNEKPKSNEEAVYEGKTARQWAAQFKAGSGDQKAAHALSELGREALPVVLELLRDPGGSADVENSRTKNEELVRDILKNIQLEKGDLTQFVALLKDEKFEVRRGAVELLGLVAKQQPEQSEACQAALKQALNDRDKAVVEAARNELKKFAAMSNEKLEALLASVRNSIADRDFHSATELIQEGRKLRPDDQRLDMLLASIDKLQADEQAAVDMARRKAEVERQRSAAQQANLARLKNEMDKATANYNAALKRNPVDQQEVDAAKQKLDTVTAEWRKLSGNQKARVGEGDLDN